MNDKGKNSTEMMKSVCTLCANTAFHVCERCDDFYCSQECQRKDWQTHRYICAPMPNLVPATVKFGIMPEVVQHPMMPEIRKATLTHDNVSVKSATSIDKIDQQKPVMSSLPKSNSRVLLTGFRSANRCGLRSLMDAENSSYLAIAKKINAYGQTAPPLRTAPKQYDYVIAPLSDLMCRAQVLSIRQNSVRILFCDVGKAAVRNLMELREISNDIMRLKQHTVMVQLLNVKNYACTDKLWNCLQAFENKEYKIKYDPQQREVELYNWNTDKCLNGEIAVVCSNFDVFGTDFGSETSLKRAGSQSTENFETSIGKIMEEEQKPVKLNRKIPAPTKDIARQLTGPVMNPPFELVVLPVGSTNVHVIVLDNSCLDDGYIGCIPQGGVPQLALVQEYLVNYEDKQKSYKPKINEYCVAKFEGEWYRAKVLDVTDEMITVVYVDYTNVSNVEASDVRYYPEGLKWNCATNLCLISDLPETLTNKQVAFLKEEIPLQSKLIIDKVTKCEEGVILIECHSLIQKMKEKSLLN